MIAPVSAQSVAEAREATRRRLEEAGLPNALGESRELVARAMGISPRVVDARLADPWSAPSQTVLDRLLFRRLERVPLAYVLEEWDFMDFTLNLTPDVLIPRPETEELFALAERVAGPTLSSDPALVDVGTGAGGLSLALARRWPKARVFAVDCSRGALAVARWNARRHGAAERIQFIEGDLLSWARRASMDMITANLPYVASTELESLAPEVRQEPRLALDGGPDGLDLIRRMAPQAVWSLRPGGMVFLEIGAGQSGATAQRLKTAGFVDVLVEKDAGGVDRFVHGRRP